MCSSSTDRRNVIGGSFCRYPFGRRNVVGRAFFSVDTYTYDGAALESSAHVVEEVGVLLLNLGGPETLNDVQPLLYNLFADPDIIRLPRLFRFFQRPLAQLISVLRAPKSKEGYAAIGGGSPLRKITYKQVHALKMALKEKPFLQISMLECGIDTHSLKKQLSKEDAYLSSLPVSIINSWYQRKGYIKSMADLIEKELQSFPVPKKVMAFFSAHGVPVSYVEDAGDPYRDQIEECIFLIMQELKNVGINNKHTLAYQSRVGPVQWLKLYTDEVIVELDQNGIRSLLAVPISFVSEHIETLEIDMEYKHLALESGIKNWGRVPALGVTSSFITDLADAVIEALPSATAMYSLKSTSEVVEHDLLKYILKMFFGSILAFILLLSPKMIMAFRNHII